MSSGEQLYKENVKALESLGVKIEGPASPYPDALSTHENLTIEPPELALRGLLRAHAIILFRELNQFLNPDAKAEDILAPLELMDEESLAVLDREEIINIETPAGSDFNLLLQEEEPLKFDFEVRKGELDEDLDSLRFLISRTFRVVMSSVHLVQASLDPEVATNPQITQTPETEAPIRTGTNQALSVRTRTRRPSRHLLWANSERKQMAEDLDEIKFILEVFGIEGVERAKDEALAKLWSSRGRDPIAIIDLYMHMIQRKAEIREDKSFAPRNNIVDVFEYAAVFKDPLALRRGLEDKSIESLITNLGINQVDARSFFMLADSEMDKLKMRVVAWLADLPTMAGYRSEIKKIHRTGNRAPAEKMYKEAINYLQAQRNMRGKYFSEDLWGGFGEVEFNKDITDDRTEFNDKLNFLENALLLAQYVFTSKDMDELISR